MRDPFSWSLPLGRVFGITVKVHLLFIIFILVMWLRMAFGKDLAEGAAVAMLVLMGMVFLSVLLHEFGHCFAARSVDGDAEEILLWPLGGLAFCDVPHTPRAHFITAAGGPAVNVVLCLLSGGVLLTFSFVPPLIPLPDNFYNLTMYNFAEGAWYGSEFAPDRESIFAVAGDKRFGRWSWQFLVGQFFFVNWFLTLFNLVVIGFPLDGGRLLQAALWPRVGYRQSMLIAVWIGFLFMFIIGIVGLWKSEVLWLCLAGFIYFACKHEWIRLETSHEDSLFGYDFSQGYTSLEQEEEPKIRKKRQNFFQRWLQKRTQKKLQKEKERVAAEESRMDELLDKIQQYGADSLTDEENRFLKRVSDRYKHKK